MVLTPPEMRISSLFSSRRSYRSRLRFSGSLAVFRFCFSFLFSPSLATLMALRPTTRRRAPAHPRTRRRRGRLRILSGPALEGNFTTGHLASSLCHSITLSTTTRSPLGRRPRAVLAGHSRPAPDSPPAAVPLGTSPSHRRRHGAHANARPNPARAAASDRGRAHPEDDDPGHFALRSFTLGGTCGVLSRECELLHTHAQIRTRATLSRAECTACKR